MKKAKNNKKNRILSLFMSIIMIATLLPLTLYAASENHVNEFTIQIVDDNNVGIDGAEVNYIISVNGVEQEEKTEYSESDGFIEIADMKNLETEISNNEVTISYTVTKAGYNSVNKSGITVTSIEDNIVVSLHAVEQKEISVNSLGNGTVKINGIEGNTFSTDVNSIVSIEIIPNTNSTYIKQLKINNQEIIVNKYDSYISNDYCLSEDTDIYVEFVDEYKVTLSPKEEGVIKINEQEIMQESCITVDSGTSISVCIKPNDGYQISKIKINEKEQLLSANEYSEYNKTLIVDEDIYIDVDYIKLYTVELNIGENGTVDTNPECTAGKLVVKDGSNFEIIANPNENYRVCEVKKYEDNKLVSQINYNENSYQYIDAVEKTEKNYKYEIIFALNQYKINAKVKNNIGGQVSPIDSIADYGTDVEVEIIPDEGYRLKTITVNQTGNDNETSQVDIENDENFIEKEDNTFCYTIKNIQKDSTLVVEFESISDVQLNQLVDEIEIYEDKDVNNLKSSYIDGNDEFFVFAKDSNVILEPINYEQIRIKYVNAENFESWADRVSITQSDEIGAIQLRNNRKPETTVNIIMSGNVKIIIDSNAPKISLSPDKECNKNGYYNSNFIVDLAVDDDVSGIAKISYTVTDDEGAKIITQEETIYEANNNKPTIKTYKKDKYDGYKGILIDTLKHNSDYVKLTVSVTDVSGNTYAESCDFKVNSTPPKISIEMISEKKEDAISGFYTKRSAKIIIDDRGTTFDEKNVILDVRAKDIAGNQINIGSMLSEWKDSADGNTHQATLDFTEDAIYSWNISYTNKADKENEDVEVKDSINDAFEFTKDSQAPKDVKITTIGKEWNQLIIEKPIFNTFGKAMKIEASANDSISRIKSIKYYKSNEYMALGEDELVALYNDNKFTDSVIEFRKEDLVNEAFVVYARIVDNAGNVVFISTDGCVVDTTEPLIKIEPDEPNCYGFYTNDIHVNVTVDESGKLETGEKFSGINKVEYIIKVGNIENGKITQNEVLYTYENKDDYNDKIENDDDTNLPKVFEDTIIVDAEDNNFDDVFIIVNVTDNAGNVVSDYKKVSINKSKPIINVKFDNNNPNTIEGERGWYGQSRTATIEITDRESTYANNEFSDEKKCGWNITISGENFKEESIALNREEMIKSWTLVNEESDESGKKVTYGTTISFNEDANYDWTIEYTNKAGISNEGIFFKDNSKTPTKFTVDKTNPTGKIELTKNKEEYTWEKLINILSFGIFFKENEYSENTINYSATDEISGVKVEYYKSQSVLALKDEELDNLYSNNQFSTDKVKLESNEHAVIYMRVTDFAGNYIYLCTDGVIRDETPPEIEIVEPENKNKYNIYNSDVPLKINVEDSGAGIKSVKYWVMKDEGTENEEKTQEDELYSFENKTPSYEELVKKKGFEINIDSSHNNSSNVSVYVSVEDNAGNTSEEKLALDIDITNPTITVSYDNNDDNNGNGYFKKGRTATITVKERANHFDSQKVEISIIATNTKGDKVEEAEQIDFSTWKHMEGETPDDAVHVSSLKFSSEANYKFTIKYVDNADNENDPVVVSKSTKAPFEFTIDGTAPTGTLSIKTDEGRSETWDKVISKLTFGIYSKEKIVVTSTSEDVISPIASIKYYKTDAVDAKTKTDLDNVKEWKDFSNLTIADNEQFTIYLRMEDMSGNVSYISTDGMIVDNKSPRIETVAPEIKITPEQPKNGLYNGDVKVSIEVQDPLEGNAYSGLKTISYRVLNMGVETQKGVLFNYSNVSPVQSELQKSWTGEIVVDSQLNNSNDVVIEVYADDNAANSAVRAESIKIDITNPVIDIRYDNNEPDSEKYYKETRTAIITVSERNFDSKDVVVNIQNTDGVIPSVSDWITYPADTGNGDNTKHVATIEYDADGDYTFDIGYIDLADNRCIEVNYAAGTVNEREFTIDKTVPKISVSYNNNSVENSKYFKQNRIATVTIVEHNFEVGRVQFTQTATLNGSPINIPTPSWDSNGDIHTATIVYDTDGDYTFDVTMTDMAGNPITAVDYDTTTAKDFTIDTKIDMPKISGIENGKAYRSEVIPKIDFSDINYNDYKIKLTRTRMSEKDVDVTDIFIKNMDVSEHGVTSTNDTFDIVKENDGIYKLTVDVSDKAGNELQSVVVFTLNRFGSVYEYNDYLISLIQNGGSYVQAVDSDLVITEYNADKLVSKSLNIEISQDGRPLEDSKYEVTPEINEQVGIGNSGWYQYKYTISKDNFSKDGVYKISVSSEDETGNTPENTPDNTNYEENSILFRVDSTPPEINSITGLEKDIINATEVEVGYTIYDTIGLSSISIEVDGQQVDKIEDFSEDLNNYSGKFKISENKSAQKVRIVVTDLAGNITDTNSKQFKSAYAFNNSVTVSTNFFVRWYANRTLFWGSISGFIVIVFGGITVIAYIRKRKKQNQN